MFNLKIEKSPAPLWVKLLLPIFAVIITMIITSIFSYISNIDPLETFRYLLVAPLSSRVSTIEIFVKSTPLILTGAAVIFAFRAGYWNIGAEGQFYAGAIVAAWLGQILVGFPVWLSITLMVLGGFIGGMLWALPSAFLKVNLNVDEVVTTLLMNTIVLFFISYLLNGPWRDPISFWPQSPTLLENTQFFKLLPNSRLHFGFIIAVFTMLIIWFILNKTPFGLKMRAAGLGKDAAEFAGIKVNKTIFITALVSGGIAGLAGLGEVAGIHYHLIEALSGNAGYTGIIVATLGGLNPIGGTFAALFIGLIDTGAQTVSRYLGVPIYLGDVIQSILLLVTLAIFLLQNYRIKRS